MISEGFGYLFAHEGATIVESIGPSGGSCPKWEGLILCRKVAEQGGLVDEVFSAHVTVVLDIGMVVSHHVVHLRPLGEADFPIYLVQSSELIVGPPSSTVNPVPLKYIPII